MSKKLDNAAQMNKVEKRIYERNPDTGQIRSRKKGDYGNERVEVKGKDNKVDIRESILSDIWAANKTVHNGKWYVELSEICNIIGADHVRK